MEQQAAVYYQQQMFAMQQQMMSPSPSGGVEGGGSKGNGTADAAEVTAAMEAHHQHQQHLQQMHMHQHQQQQYYMQQMHGPDLSAMEYSQAHMHAGQQQSTPQQPYPNGVMGPPSSLQTANASASASGSHTYIQGYHLGGGGNPAHMLQQQQHPHAHLQQHYHHPAAYMYPGAPPPMVAPDGMLHHSAGVGLPGQSSGVNPAVMHPMPPMITNLQSSSSAAGGQGQNSSSPSNNTGGNARPFHEVKRRRRLTPDETRKLTAVFTLRTTKPDSNLRLQLAEEMGMTPRAIQVWFQNRRAKMKRERELVEKEMAGGTDGAGGVIDGASPSRSGDMTVHHHAQQMYQQQQFHGVHHMASTEDFGAMTGGEIDDDDEFANDEDYGTGANGNGEMHAAYGYQQDLSAAADYPSQAHYGGYPPHPHQLQDPQAMAAYYNAMNASNMHMQQYPVGVVDQSGVGDSGPNLHDVYVQQHQQATAIDGAELGGAEFTAADSAYAEGLINTEHPDFKEEGLSHQMGGSATTRSPLPGHPQTASSVSGEQSKSSDDSVKREGAADAGIMAAALQAAGLSNEDISGLTGLSLEQTSVLLEQHHAEDQQAQRDLDDGKVNPAYPPSLYPYDPAVVGSVDAAAARTSPMAAASCSVAAPARMTAPQPGTPTGYVYIDPHTNMLMNVTVPASNAAGAPAVQSPLPFRLADDEPGRSASPALKSRQGSLVMLGGGNDIPYEYQAHLQPSISPSMPSPGGSLGQSTVSPQQTVAPTASAGPPAVLGRMRAHSVGGYHLQSGGGAQRGIKPMPLSIASPYPPYCSTPPTVLGTSSPLAYSHNDLGSMPSSPVIPSHVTRPVPIRRGSVDGRKEIRKSRSVVNSPYWGTSVTAMVGPGSPIGTSKSTSLEASGDLGSVQRSPLVDSATALSASAWIVPNEADGCSDSHMPDGSDSTTLGMATPGDIDMDAILGLGEDFAGDDFSLLSAKKHDDIARVQQQDHGSKLRRPNSWASGLRNQAV